MEIGRPGRFGGVAAALGAAGGEVCGGGGGDLISGSAI